MKLGERLRFSVDNRSNHQGCIQHNLLIMLKVRSSVPEHQYSSWKGNTKKEMVWQ